MQSPVLYFWDGSGTPFILQSPMLWFLGAPGPRFDGHWRLQKALPPSNNHSFCKRGSPANNHSFCKHQCYTFWKVLNSWLTFYKVLVPGMEGHAYLSVVAEPLQQHGCTRQSAKRQTIHFQARAVSFRESVENTWVFPKIRIPQNGWFIVENPIKNGWFGGTIIFGNIHIDIQHFFHLEHSRNF